MEALTECRGIGKTITPPNNAVFVSAQKREERCAWVPLLFSRAATSKRLGLPCTSRQYPVEYRLYPRELIQMNGR